MIAKQYLITGIIMGIVGVMMSLLFRMQLAWPEESFKIFNVLLGDKFAPDGVMSNDIYLALVTIHGTIMVFFVLTAGLSGTFSNLLIPLQIGARDMASGFMNMVSFWLFFLSAVIMLASLFVEAGPASAGWTIYPPLSALPQTIAGSGAGMTLWLVSMAIFIASSLMGSIETSLEGHTKITITVDDEETTFEMSQKQTILEAALKQGIDAPYSCQGGICSSCLCRVTQGTAEMKKNSILTDKEIADGLILSCQAHPTSAEIVVDFDDV